MYEWVPFNLVGREAGLLGNENGSYDKPGVTGLLGVATVGDTNLPFAGAIGLPELGLNSGIWIGNGGADGLKF